MPIGSTNKNVSSLITLILIWAIYFFCCLIISGAKGKSVFNNVSHNIIEKFLNPVVSITGFPYISILKLYILVFVEPC